MHGVMKVLALLFASLLALSACSDSDSPQAKESESRQQGYDQLAANQPGEIMSYSPTRETINFWVNTWEEPGKLSFVYLMNANGETIGYYVLEGLPVSMCAAISPTYEFRTWGGNHWQVPAPANDGVYYSGGQCDTYYGKDATTGTYLEYTAGLGINVLLFEEPMPNQADARPLGPTTMEDVDQ